MLELGLELSKNEQKKVLGGAFVLCFYDDYLHGIGNFANCSSAAAYCIGAHRGTVVSCTP